MGMDMLHTGANGRFGEAAPQRRREQRTTGMGRVCLEGRPRFAGLQGRQSAHSRRSQQPGNFDLVAVTHTRITERARKRPVNPPWGVPEPGRDLHSCFRQQHKLSNDNLIGWSISSAKKEAHVEGYRSRYTEALRAGMGSDRRKGARVGDSPLPCKRQGMPLR